MTRNHSVDEDSAITSNRYKNTQPAVSYGFEEIDDGSTEQCEPYHWCIYNPPSSSVPRESGNIDRCSVHGHSQKSTEAGPSWTADTAFRTTPHTGQQQEEDRKWEDRFYESRQMCSDLIRRSDKLSEELQDARDKDLDMRRVMRDLERLVVTLRKENDELQTTVMRTASSNAAYEREISTLKAKLSAEEAVGVCQADLATSVQNHILRESANAFRSVVEKSSTV